MKRVFTWIVGGLGLAAVLRLRRRPHEREAPSGPDPADELRRKLDEARSAPDDRADFDAAEGMAVDEAEPPASPGVAPRSIEERRRAIHEKAQEALGEMHGTPVEPSQAERDE